MKTETKVTKKKVTKRKVVKKAAKKTLTDEERAARVQARNEALAKKRAVKKYEAEKAKKLRIRERQDAKVEEFDKDFKELCKKHNMKSVAFFENSKEMVQGTVVSDKISNFEVYGMIKLLGPSN